MKIIIFIVLMFAIGAALALKLLPLWLAITLIVLIGVPLFWIIWKITRFFKKLKKTLADYIPQEKLSSLKPGETFKGHGFAFTFPVACDVAHTDFHELEVLILKPKFEFADAPKDTLLMVSTMSREELKTNLNQKLEAIIAKVPGAQTEEFTPTQVGSLSGERRGFAASHGGKSIKGETVYLGDATCSVGWVAMGNDAMFDTLASKYRELAMLVQRVETKDAPKPALEEGEAEAPQAS